VDDDEEEAIKLVFLPTLTIKDSHECAQHVDKQPERSTHMLGVGSKDETKANVKSYWNDQNCYAFFVNDEELCPNTALQLFQWLVFVNL